MDSVSVKSKDDAIKQILDLRKEVLRLNSSIDSLKTTPAKSNPDDIELLQRFEKTFCQIVAIFNIKPETVDIEDLPNIIQTSSNEQAHTIELLRGQLETVQKPSERFKSIFGTKKNTDFKN